MKSTFIGDIYMHNRNVRNTASNEIIFFHGETAKIRQHITLQTYRKNKYVCPIILTHYSAK